MDTKNEKKKKGFWASLFIPKACSCSCGDSLIVEVDNKSDAVCGCASGCGDKTPAALCCCGEPAAVKEIKVLGPGCAKCKAAYGVIEKVVRTGNLDVRLTKVDDIAEIMSYNIMATPAVVVDGVVWLKGRVPTESEVKELLGI